jgi:hypothetical protein
MNEEESEEIRKMSGSGRERNTEGKEEKRREQGWGVRPERR